MARTISRLCDIVTEIGKIAGAIMERGELVPDDVLFKGIYDQLIQQEASREISEPCAPQALYRSYPGHDARVRAADLPCARAASIDTAQDAAWGR